MNVPDPLGPLPVRRQRQEPVLPLALLASVLVHALILTLPVSLDAPTDERRGRGAAARPADRSMRLVRLRTHEEPRLPETPETQTVPKAIPTLLDAPASPPSTGAEGDSVRRAPAEGLRPRHLDAKLWPIRREPATDPAYRQSLELERGADLFHRDAAGIYAPPGGDMSVWTARDGKDRRWGFSPGVIHLGSLTIPFCSGKFDAANCGFGIPPVFRDAYHLQLRARLEIQRQVRFGELQERARVVRARLDSLRRSR